MKYKELGKTHTKIPVIGQGTGIGGFLAKTAVYDEKHVRAIRLGVDLGMTFIDTAEVYGSGQAEETVAKAIKGIRNEVFIATKFSPEHNSYNGVLRAVEGSLKRLKTDYIDLYQMHWPNPTIPLEETIRAMKKLYTDGKIRYIGLCNVSLMELSEAKEMLGDIGIVSVQNEYNLFDRSIENDILPYCEREKLSIIAYSPLNQGRMTYADKKQAVIRAIAEKYDKSIAQIMLRWLIDHTPVVVIPNATKETHIRENVAVDFSLASEDINKINEVFKQDLVYVQTEKIRVYANNKGKTNVYQTVEDAIENKMGMVPSPLDLSKHLKKGYPIKPIRLVPITDKTGRYDYELIEGRLRYWAYVIAYGGKVPIPAYICDILEG